MSRVGSQLAPHTHFVAAGRKPSGIEFSGETPEGLRPAATIGNVSGIGLALVALMLCAGCGEIPLDTSYGSRSGESVAGTAILSRMFQQAGHDVTSWRALSPRVYEADTIVWAPDRFTPPDAETIEWLDQWMQDTHGTLIYIGRDYCAAVDYWDQVLPIAPPAQAKEIKSERAAELADFRVERSAIAQPLSCGWFTVDGSGGAPQPVKKPSGPWTQSINVGQADLELGATLTPVEEPEVLLAAGDKALVSRVRTTWDESGELLLVANGSFVLNLPLVNHENRKLAGQLIDAVGPPGDVLFLESGDDDPKILDEDPQSNMPTGLEVLFVWPLNFILLHLAVLGILFAFARAPIFGLPKTLPSEPLSDFGRHVAALADLLRGTKDRGYATAQLSHYHQMVHGEAATHRPPPPPPPSSPPPRAADDPDPSQTN